MTPAFIHSAQFWTWLLEWASQGIIPVMVFLCSEPAHSSCGLWTGPRLSSCLQGTSLFSNTCLLFLGVSCITIKQHWVHLCSEKVPLYVFLPTQHVMMFPFPGLNSPIIHITIILWNQLKYCFFLTWSLTGISLFSPVSPVALVCSLVALVCTPVSSTRDSCLCQSCVCDASRGQRLCLYIVVSSREPGGACHTPQ